MYCVSVYLGTLVSRLNVKVFACNQKLTHSRAGGPGTNQDDVKWLDDALKIFLKDGSWPAQDVPAPAI